MLITDYLSSNIIIFFPFFDLTYFREVGQKHRNIFVGFLIQMKTSENHSEINSADLNLPRLVKIVKERPLNLSFENRNNNWTMNVSF